MKNLKKKNNKGFSLVELIVVVMIMAILAVALAPQVMKWVGHSRVAADQSSYSSLVSACNLVLTDTATVTAIGTSTITITVSTTGTRVGGATPTTAESAVATELALVLPNYTSIKRQDTTTAGVADYTITLTATAVTPGVKPSGTIVE